MNLQHFTVGTVGRSRLTRTSAELLRAVRALAQPERLLFSIADEHLHTVDHTENPGLRGRDLVRRLRVVLPGVEFQAPHITPVEDRAHLRRLVTYLIEQPAKHGLPGHPALWPGHCLFDLLGARRLDGFSAAPLKVELPRLRGAQLLAALGLPAVKLRPVADESLRRLGLVGLLEAAAGVLGLPTIPMDRARLTTRFRTLAVHAAQVAGFPRTEVANVLGVSTRSLRKHAARAVDPTQLRSLRLWVAIYELVTAQARQAC